MDRSADIRTKTRALRKYEGEATVVGIDTTMPQMELLSPFGPLVARSEVSPSLLARLNSFADRETKQGVGSEFVVPSSIAAEGGDRSLLAVLHAQVERYVTLAEGRAPSRIAIDVIWIVSQYAATPSPVHFHSGDLSGVLYLKGPTAPPDVSEFDKTYISGRQAGYLNFITGGKQRFAKTLFSVAPDPGAIYIFPGWLLHGAEPFKGPGERRSLSFNARLD